MNYQRGIKLYEEECYLSCSARLVGANQVIFWSLLDKCSFVANQCINNKMAKKNSCGLPKVCYIL